jgi:hypothetical protein
MDLENQKATQFVQRLLANPTLAPLTPLQKEEQVVQFLKANAQQLYPTLCSPAFFPGKGIQQIQQLLCQSLSQLINQDLYTILQNEISKIDFSFTAFFREQKTPIPHLNEACLEFQKELLNKPEARFALVGPLTALSYDVTDKYIDAIFRRREYIHLELTRAQRLKLSKENFQHYLKATLLLKNGVHLLISSEVQPGMASFVVQSSFVEKVYRVVKDQLKVMPEQLIQSALNSNLSFLENPLLDAPARLAAIFALRCQNFRVYQTIDRGAETPDKSWFNIARKNYKYYGFDIKFLDELYKIAGEAGW